MKINNENGVKGIFLVIFCISIFLFTRSNGYNILPFSNNIMLYLYSVIGSIVILYLSTSRIKLKAIDILCLVYFIYNLLWLLVTSKTKNIETIYLFFFLAMLYINIRNISSIYYKYILYSFPFIVISHFIYYICWENPYYFLYEHKGVFTGFLHNSGLWGEFVAMTLICNIGLIHLNKKSKKTSTLLIFVSFIVSFMLYESDSRASFFRHRDTDFLFTSHHQAFAKINYYPNRKLININLSLHLSYIRVVFIQKRFCRWKNSNLENFIRNGER